MYQLWCRNRKTQGQSCLGTFQARHEGEKALGVVMPKMPKGELCDFHLLDEDFIFDLYDQLQFALLHPNPRWTLEEMERMFEAIRNADGQPKKHEQKGEEKDE